MQFLPKILVKSADMFAFMVTISKPGLKNATAVQFLKLEDGTFHRFVASFLLSTIMATASRRSEASCLGLRASSLTASSLTEDQM